jgi:site-specific DNA recombinase
MPKHDSRTAWVSYLRVSTAEQADRELSLPAQRRAVEDYAARASRSISREYVEAGCSGTHMNRRAFRQMLEDIFRPGSDIGTIVVHHTSRFTRNATEARVVKEKFRKEGVRVVSVCQEMTDDPVGQLVEGIFECIDQYESEMNGMRTAAAMREAVRQGYFPGAQAPFGFARARVELRPGITRFVLVPDEHEASIVRTLFQLYVADNGAKSVATALNSSGLPYRRGGPWDKDLVLHVLDEPAVAGTYYWGRWSTKRKKRKDDSEWLPLQVKPIVETSLYELAHKLREDREPTRNPGTPRARQNLLARLLHCSRCGSTYQLETSGKRASGGLYQYRYYNCRTFCRIGKTACVGGRIPMADLDSAVLDHVTSAVCRDDRCEALLRDMPRGARGGHLHAAWSSLLRAGGVVSRNYLLHLIQRIEVREKEIVIVPHAEFGAPVESQSKDEPLEAAQFSLTGVPT